MKNTIKIALSIAVKTAVRWGVIFFGGVIVTLITLISAIYLNINFANTQESFMSLLFSLMMSNIFAFVLIFGAPVFVALYFILANKTSVQNAIYLLWQGGAGDYISSTVEHATKNLTEQAGWRKNISDKVILKAKILQSTKNEQSTSLLQRKIIGFILQKIRLDEVDLQDNTINISDIVVGEFNDFIEETIQPSLFFVWSLVVVQIALLVASMLV